MINVVITILKVALLKTDNCGDMSSIHYICIKETFLQDFLEILKHSEFLVNLEEMIPQYYMHSDISRLKSAPFMLPVSKG